MKKVLGTIFIIIYAIIAITVTVLLLSYNDYKCSEIGGYTICIVKDAKLEPNYKKGDLLIIKQAETEDIKIGDEILLYKTITSSEYEIKNAKVTNIVEEGRRTIFQVEGDEQYDSSYLIGKNSEVKVFSTIGSILGVLESRWGYLFFVVIVSLLLFLQEVFELIMEIKYGNEKKEQTEGSK